MTTEDGTNAQPVQLPMAPNRVREAALAELARLTEIVQRLTLADWTKPNACGDWSVGDVVAHLNLIMALHNRLLRAVTAGKGSGSVWRTVGRLSKKVVPATSPALNAINSAIPRMLDRTLAPDVIKGQFSATSRGLHEILTQVGSSDYTRPVYYQGGPWPLSFLLAALVDELALHGWDMAHTLDPHAYLSEDARTVLPSFFWSGTPFMLFMPKSTSGTIAVSLADPATEMWWTVTAGKATQGLGEPASADATIRGESGTFVLTVGGRLRPEDAVRLTSLQTSGNEELASAFLRSWRIL